MTIAAKATDEYGLKGVTLHYSVNGGPDTSVDVLKKKGEKQADGSTTISLEDFKLVPGDLVSVYATAKDANAEAHTDMMFIQADPFEREFSQSQVGRRWRGRRRWRRRQSARADLAAREGNHLRDVQAAGDKNSTAQQATDISKLLSESQPSCTIRPMTLSSRVQARELTDEVEAISDFQKDMMAGVPGDGAGRATTESSRSGKTRFPMSRRRCNTCCARKRRSGRFR